MKVTAATMITDGRLEIFIISFVYSAFILLNVDPSSRDLQEDFFQ